MIEPQRTDGATSAKVDVTPWDWPTCLRYRALIDFQPRLRRHVQFHRIDGRALKHEVRMRPHAEGARNLADIRRAVRRGEPRRRHAILDGEVERKWIPRPWREPMPKPHDVDRLTFDAPFCPTNEAVDRVS